MRRCANAASSTRPACKPVLLFGIPDFKDAVATSNYDPNGVVQRAARAIKDALPQMLVIADLCNCEYTDHGHCGIIDDRRRRRQRPHASSCW